VWDGVLKLVKGQGCASRRSYCAVDGILTGSVIPRSNMRNQFHSSIFPREPLLSFG
jgi:hypothetical protein